MEVSFEIGGEPFNEYSEDNVRLNELIAADVILNYMRGRFNFPKYNTTILQSKDLPKSLLKALSISLMEPLETFTLNIMEAIGREKRRWN